MLEVLVYTDATATESLNGSLGFSFIACSPGTSPSDETFVKQQQHLLPADLPADDWQSHPPTCGYSRSGDRMYLSRGHSTGKTVGGRPGNQLTVTVMTSEAFDFLPLRPAQLYASPEWDFSRPTSKNLSAWEAPVEIDESFEVSGLHALIVEDQWATSVLPNVLTMLDLTQAERRRRLLIRHSDQAVVMRWVALLSHFLDANRALGFEFRVFTDRPLSANQHVVGVHPLIAPNLTVEAARQEGVNMLDLERRELSAITPTEAAIRYARWFTSGDPYEALEAVEVARRWSRHMDPDIAAVAAELATMEASPGAPGADALQASLVALRALAEAGQQDELDAYGDALADVFASSPPIDSFDFLSIDCTLWSVADIGDVALTQSLAVAALEWVGVRPRLLAAWTKSFRGSGRVDWENGELRNHAAGLLAAGLSDVEDSLLPEAFSLANSLNTNVSAAALTSPIRRLANLWALDPGLSSRASGWAQVDTLTARLDHVLDARLTAADPEATASLLRGDWDWLSPTPWVVTTASPMSAWIAVREIRGVGPERRAEVLDTVGTSLPSSAWRVLLPDRGQLAPAEVASWISTHNDLDPGLAVELDRILGDLRRFPDWRRASGGAAVLHRIGRLKDGVSFSLRQRAAAQEQIIDLFKSATQARNQSSNAALRRLHERHSTTLNGLYGDWITKAILESEDTAAAVALADGDGQSAVIVTTRERLEQDLRTPTPSAMLSAVRLLDPSLGIWSAAATDTLNAVWDDRSMQVVRGQLLASVEQQLTLDQRDWLDYFISTQAKGRFARGVLRGAKSVITARDAKK